MRISDQDVRHLEVLAALRLSDPERERMRAHLEHILEYMDQLNAIDVAGVPPTSHVLDAGNVLREDHVTPSLPVADVLRNAPDARGSFYRVPRFVGEAEAEA
jgi:aspartyl-tRNA(Asn)/glutamyl-tRNA(Gln) amidotransferase subunit C